MGRPHDHLAGTAGRRESRSTTTTGRTSATQLRGARRDSVKLAVLELLDRPPDPTSRGSTPGATPGSTSSIRAPSPRPSRGRSSRSPASPSRSRPAGGLRLITPAARKRQRVTCRILGQKLRARLAVQREPPGRTPRGEPKVKVGPMRAPAATARGSERRTDPAADLHIRINTLEQHRRPSETPDGRLCEGCITGFTRRPLTLTRHDRPSSPRSPRGTGRAPRVRCADCPRSQIAFKSKTVRMADPMGPRFPGFVSLTPRTPAMTFASVLSPLLIAAAPPGRLRRQQLRRLRWPPRADRLRPGHPPEAVRCPACRHRQAARSSASGPPTSATPRRR